MYSPVSLCLSVCLLIGLFKNYQSNLYKKFSGIVGNKPASNRLHFEWPWCKVNVTEVKRSKSFLANNSVQNVAIHQWMHGGADLSRCNSVLATATSILSSFNNWPVLNFQNRTKQSEPAVIVSCTRPEIFTDSTDPTWATHTRTYIHIYVDVITYLLVRRKMETGKCVR